MSDNASMFAQSFLHGTKADLKLGDLIVTGYQLPDQIVKLADWIKVVSRDVSCTKRLLRSFRRLCPLIEAMPVAMLFDSGQTFVAAIRPRIAVISVGRHNTFGHPAPATIDVWRSIGAAVIRTDRCGAISLTHAAPPTVMLRCTTSH